MSLVTITYYYIVFIIAAPQKSPSNLRYTELQSRSINLQWDPLETQDTDSSNDTYTLRLSGCGESQETTRFTNAYMNVSNLCPNSVYSISVRACTSNYGCGMYSSSIQIQTQEDGKCMFIIIII